MTLVRFLVTANQSKSNSHAAVSPGQTQSFNAVPSLRRSLLTGALGFGFTSLCVFGTVAFAERWMYTHLGLPGAYLVWTILFIVIGGGALGSLVAGGWRLPKFYLLFGLAFFAYAAGWVGAYFTVRGAAGEWVGSLVGSIVMGSLFAVGFGKLRSAITLSVLLFVGNSIGYFAGSGLNNYFGGRAGMLLWGIVYGLCLGAALGAVLHFVQLQKEAA